MNEDRKKILEQIDNMPIDDLLIEAPKKKRPTFKEVLKEVLLWRFKFIGAIFGVTEDTIGSYSSSGHGGGHSSHTSHPPHSGGNDFKSQYIAPRHPGTINPVDIANAREYYESIDGKGDDGR